MTEDQVLLTTYGTDEEHGALKPALYHLDRELGHWSAVDASVIRIGKKPLLLFGYDGDALVLSTGLPKLSWVAVSR